MSFNILVECLSIGKTNIQCQFTIGRLSVDYQLIYRPTYWKLFVCQSSQPILSEVLVKYRQCVSKVSARYRLTKNYIGRHTSRAIYRPTIARVSTRYWPTLDRQSTDSRPIYCSSVQKTLFGKVGNLVQQILVLTKILFLYLGY